MILAVSGFALLVRQPLLLVRLAALLAMKREIEEQLTHAIAQKQRQMCIRDSSASVLWLILPN